MRVARFRLFKSIWGLSTVLPQAAAFATEVGPERLIGISHSTHGAASVVVWYWD
jgi:hypothetical protein